MLRATNGRERKKVVNKLVAVAVDRDKVSQGALKWTVETLLNRGQTVVLLHVKAKPSQSISSQGFSQLSDVNGENGLPVCSSDLDSQFRELFLPYRCYCTRKDVQCLDVVLEDTDVVKALVEYVSRSAIEILVLGSASKGGLFKRFRATDIPSNVAKEVPDFCTVYVISKGKISSIRAASRPAPASSHLRDQILCQHINRSDQSETLICPPIITNGAPIPKPRTLSSNNLQNDKEFFKSPFTHRKNANGKSYGELSVPETDISFVSSKAGVDQLFPSFYDDFEMSQSARMSNYSDFNDPQLSGYSDFNNQMSSYSDFNNQKLPRTSSYSPRMSSYSDFNNQISNYSDFNNERSPRISSYSNFNNPNRFESMDYRYKSSDTIAQSELSLPSSNSVTSPTSQALEDIEAEMRRLKMELKQTMEMYSTAYREALPAKQKTKELQRWKMDKEHKLEEVRLAEEGALEVAEKEKVRFRAATEAAEAAKRIAELEAQERIKAEKKARNEKKEKNKVIKKLMQSDFRYRRYTIEDIEEATDFFAESRKIGEGGYGPVYRCYLDHTEVAVKVLRPDATQGRSQFQKEVEVLSCIRHPNMVLLLGACPEYGCLVYDYMSNGSLEERLFRRGNTPPLSWQQRFRIAAEIGTGLLFLHQNKPEPIVHRDLKPGNILLDRNYVSKISDVGLARLVPPSVADTVTQYRMTSTAGTFCYIDPEYQQTGMLGVKSDIYSLGIMFLQIITARPPMGVTHQVGRAIEKGNFAAILDPAVLDWPIEEALSFAKLALSCAELRRKDRPDLGKVVMPELQRLRKLADDSMMPDGGICSNNHSQVSICQDELSGPIAAQSR